MSQNGGFSIFCNTEDAAKKVFDCAREFLSNEKLQNTYWHDFMKVSKDKVFVDTQVYIVWEDYEGLFENMCEYVEKKYPGIIQAGSANYCDTGSSFSDSSTFERSGDTLEYEEEFGDSVICDMYDSGLDLEEIADITGRDIEEIAEILDIEL